jgi:hypothetical protein
MYRRTILVLSENNDLVERLRAMSQLGGDLFVAGERNWHTVMSATGPDLVLIDFSVNATIQNMAIRNAPSAAFVI